MSNLDNPAARLETVLARAQAIVDENQLSAIDGWRRVFQVEEADEVPAMVAEFIEQVRLARTAIGELPDTDEPQRLLSYFGLLDKIVKGMLMLAAQPMEMFRPFITDSLLFSLGSCANALRRNGLKEPVFDGDAVGEILSVIHDVLDEVAASDLPTNVRIFIVGRLRDVEAALRAFQVGGYSGVEAALDALLGAALWRTPDEAKERVGNLVQRIIVKFKSVTRDTAEIAGSAQKLIEAANIISGQ